MVALHWHRTTARPGVCPGTIQPETCRARAVGQPDIDRGRPPTVM